MNIKEIALKIADSLRNKVDGISHMQSNQGLVAFAEAIIAELAKQNKPVGYVDYGDRLEWYGTKPLPETDLYTLPPTAEQIANETAEAIAELLESQHTWITKESASALVRSGAWKEFKK